MQTPMGMAYLSIVFATLVVPVRGSAEGVEVKRSYDKDADQTTFAVTCDHKQMPNHTACLEVKVEATGKQINSSNAPRKGYHLKVHLVRRTLPDNWRGCTTLYLQNGAARLSFGVRTLSAVKYLSSGMGGSRWKVCWPDATAKQMACDGWHRGTEANVPKHLVKEKHIALSLADWDYCRFKQIAEWENFAAGYCGELYPAASSYARALAKLLKELPVPRKQSCSSPRSRM